MGLPGNELYLTITPKSLREIADDLENDPDNGRTVTTDEGIFVTIYTPEEEN